MEERHVRLAQGSSGHMDVHPNGPGPGRARFLRSVGIGPYGGLRAPLAVPGAATLDRRRRSVRALDRPIGMPSDQVCGPRRDGGHGDDDQDEFSRTHPTEIVRRSRVAGYAFLGWGAGGLGSSAFPRRK